MDIATELMINEEIRDREVRLIDENGEQLGVMGIQQALALAEERGFDLAKIQPSAVPPVCKLLDYDKYRYEQAKRERENRKNQRVVDIKEVQLSATIEENDVNTKAKMAIRFLENGDKVKVSIRFRGRQITHSEIGLKVMQDFAERCKDVSMVERRPLLDGRNMIMILAPKAIKASFAERKAKRENQTMPKQKSHRGAAKRFSFTKSGIVRHKQMNANHQVRLKTTKRTRHLRNPGVVDNAAEARTIHKLLPYK